MSAVDGNTSTTSSVESGYATSSTAPAILGDSVERIDSVDMPAREPSMVAGEPELQSPRETETTVDASRGKTVRVTLEEPQIGKRRLASWCWQFVSRFSPSVNDRNVLCLVRRSNGELLGKIPAVIFPPRWAVTVLAVITAIFWHYREPPKSLSLIHI